MFNGKKLSDAFGHCGKPVTMEELSYLPQLELEIVPPDPGRRHAENLKNDDFIRKNGPSSYSDLRMPQKPRNPGANKPN